MSSKHNWSSAVKHAMPGSAPLRIGGVVMMLIAIILIFSGVGVMINISIVSGLITAAVGFCVGLGAYKLIED